MCAGSIIGREQNKSSDEGQMREAVFRLGILLYHR